MNEQKDGHRVTLEDGRYFATVNGLWIGKKGPFATAGVIRNTNFREYGAIDYTDVAVIEVEERQLATRLLEPGDIILERSGGGPRQPVGRVVYFDREDGTFSFSNFTSVIRVRDLKAFHPRFVFYVLLWLYLDGRTEDIQRRTTGIRNLDFMSYKRRAAIPCLPMVDQKRVANQLDVVLHAIEVEDRANLVATELKAALLETIFAFGMRQEDRVDSPLGPIPKSWSAKRLADSCDIVSGSMSYADFVSGAPAKDGVSCMAVKVSDMNLKGNETHFRRANAEKLLDAGSATKLVPARSVVLPKRGAAIATNKKRLTTVPTALDPNLIALAPRDGVLAEFVYYWSQTFDLRRITAPGPTPQLNKKDLSPVLMPLPPTLDEQSEVVKALEAVDKTITAHARRRASLSQLFELALDHVFLEAEATPTAGAEGQFKPLVTG